MTCHVKTHNCYSSLVAILYERLFFLHTLLSLMPLHISMFNIHVYILYVHKTTCKFFIRFTGYMTTTNVTISRLENGYTHTIYILYTRSLLQRNDTPSISTSPYVYYYYLAVWCSRARLSS